MTRHLRHLLATITTLAFAATAALAQQVPDTTFDTRIERPAYGADGPRLLFDEGHHNFHTADGRYLTFARLARSDGYRVTPNRTRFTPALLRRHDLLVIANALGHEDMGTPEAERAAFTPKECDAVRDWVRAGGALLLIADHAPMGSSARPLAERFGVDFRNGYLIDTTIADRSMGESILVFSRENGMLGEHPILHGRDQTEMVSRVKSFAGQSLAGPPGSTPLLRLSDAAEDLLVGLGQFTLDVPSDKRKSAAGRSQGLAFAFGKGRVVVLGEAGMLSAQIAGPPGQSFKMGMNEPGIDNRQFAINVMRWLSGALEPR